MTVPDLQQCKRERRKIAVVTAYDALFARIVEQAGINVILVGEAEFMNANIPGVCVPQDMIDEMRAAGDKRGLDAGVEIAVRTIKAVRPYCDGVHVMAIKATERLPEILTKAELG